MKSIKQRKQIDKRVEFMRLQEEEMMEEAEAEEEMKKKSLRKETSLKRKAKPGKLGHKNWKRATSRKKELEEYERTSSESSVEIVP